MDYEVQAAVTALGYLDGDKYQKEADCFETIKDLIRYLRRDGESRSIRRHLGESNIAESDLVPILITYSDDLPLFDATLRLLINLTQPAIQCFNDKIPPDFATRQTFLEIHDHLRRSKRCFTKESLYKILYSKLNDLLKLDWEHRQEEDRISIERLLTLLKNILALPPAEEDQRRTDTDITLHDQILWAIHRSGLEDIILLIAECDEERRFHLLILEIIGLMLKDHKTEQLAKAGLERSDVEKRKDEQALQSLHEKGKVQKFANLKRCSGRHSNFAGSYVVHGLKSIIDDRDVVSHKVLTKVDHVTLDDRKKRKRPAKKPLLFENEERKSALTIRLFLKQFCERFLEKYSNFIDSIRQLLSRVDRRRHMIECYYIWCIRFFTEFARNSTNINDSLKFILSTVSLNSFHYLLMQMNDYYEMMKTDKFEAITWGKSFMKFLFFMFHNALQTYKELFLVLGIMEKSSNEEYIDISMDIKKHIFYVVEYSEYFLDYLKNFNPATMSKACLKDLIECVHVYMKLFELHCQVYGGAIKVQKKQRKRKARNKKEAVKVEETEEQMNERLLEEKENQWDTVSGELSSVLQGHIDVPTDAVPFDVLAEHGFDEKTVAKVRIQESLKKNEPAVSVALLRASRQLWPEDSQIFGNTEMEPEDEFLLIRQIFFTEFPKIAGENCPLLENVDVSEENAEEEENVEEDDDILNEELEDAEREFVTKEVDFSFLSYVQRFARHDILTWYIWLLEDFESNSSSLNHCILKLFHRIVYELKSAGTLYQARLFRIFQNLSNLPAYNRLAHLEELTEFAKHFLRTFFDMANKNKKIFAEILFWKNMKEVYELEYGYGSFKVETQNKKRSKRSKKKKDNTLEELNENLEEGIFNDNADLPYLENDLKDEKDESQVNNWTKNFNVDEEMEEKNANYNENTKLLDFNDDISKGEKRKRAKISKKLLKMSKAISAVDRINNDTDVIEPAAAVKQKQRVLSDDDNYEDNSEFENRNENEETEPLILHTNELESKNDFEEPAKRSNRANSVGVSNSDTEDMGSPVNVKRTRRILSDDED